MRYSIRRVALALAAVMSLLAPMSRAQSNTFVVEAQIDATPLDLEVTPNGKLAVVRGNTSANPSLPDDWRLSFWNTKTGTRVLPDQPGKVGRGNLPVHPTTGKPMFCNAIAVTNSAVLAIGSADTQAPISGEVSAEDTTYVDYLSVTYDLNGDPQVHFVRRYALLDPSPTASTQMGGAHDVEVTPDGSFAVVSHNNWVHVFDMSSGLQLFAYNTGANGPCTPYWSRNSLEVTNLRAVVATGRRISATGFETDFYVFGLSATPALLGGGTVPHQPDPVGTWDFGPHDLAITPNGDRVVIAANRSVQLYNITSMADQGAYVDNYDTRRWQMDISTTPAVDLWDSLEVSDTRAVVLSNRLTADGGGYAPDGWGIRVFDIGHWAVLSSPGQPLWSRAAQDAEDPVWDVAMSSDGLQATVKSRTHDMALLDVVSPAAGTASFLSAGPLPNRYNTAVPTSSGTPGINDATVCLAESGLPTEQRWVAFTGLPAPGVARIFLFDLAAGGWPAPPNSTSVTGADFQESTPSGKLAAADMALTTDGANVVLRLSAPMVDSGTPGGVDWSRFRGVSLPASPAVGDSFGGRGECVAADSLRVARSKAVSISRDDTPGSKTGWIHIVKVQ